MQLQQQVRGEALRVGELARAGHVLELGGGEPGGAHVLLGVLALVRARGELGGQEHVPALARHARRHLEEADALDAAGDQPRLLPQLADGQRGGVDVRALGRGAGRELPAAAADRVAELLDEVQPVAVARDHERVGRLVDHPVDALGAVGEPDRVLPDGHPGVGVDLAAGERLHAPTVPGAGTGPHGGAYRDAVRLVIARCQVDYVGRLTAHLPMAPRLLLVKADGSVSVHADDRAYKPLNWMSPPCWLEEQPGVWTVRNKADESLVITIDEVLHDTSHELGVDPGLVKDGVEAHLQELLAAHPTTLGEGFTLVRREYMTAIGPVDLLCRDAAGATVAVEVKRRGEIDGVEQLTRYLELLGRDPLLTPVTGVFAAQQIKPQARTLAVDRGIRCVVVDYDALRGRQSDDLRLF